MKIKNREIRKIAVLYGGWSAEREISIASGKAVIEALKKLKFNVVPIDLKKNAVRKLFNLKADFVFIALHGKFGEDGTIQAILELLGIPYSGSNALSSSIGMNKVLTKKLLTFHKIPTPRWVEINSSERIELPFGFPAVVKPVSQGSTIGVSIVKDYKALSSAIKMAKKYDNDVFIEEYIPGKEITAGILGEDVLPLIEIVPLGETFYTYKAKYTPGGSKHIIPAVLENAVAEKVKNYALAVFKAIGCRGMARVDFRVDKYGNPWVLEINTIPGMTKLSLLPEAAKCAGISFEKLVLKIIEYSL
jgi:D-alanine-D-alanine ligase